MNLIKENAKTVAVFVFASLANAFYNLFTGGTPLPQTKEEWTQYAVTTVSAMAAAWLARNKITQKQLDADPNVVGGTVVADKPPTQPPVPQPDQPPPSPTAYHNPWRT